MDETIRTLVRLLGDAMDRLDEALEDAKHWQEVAGREILRAKDLEKRLMPSGSKPNGSEAA